MDDILLFDLVWACIKKLGIGRTGTATGGSTTTIVDTNGLKKVDNRFYDEGTAFILKDVGGLGEAPENSFSVVSLYDSLSKTLTLESTLAEVVAGDIYGVASRRYPLYMIVQEINSALFLDGYIPVEDTSLTTASEQTEYTLPIGASRDLKQVMVQTNQDADKNLWIDVLNWNIKYSATGSQDTLVLAYQLPANYSLLLRYATPHAELRDAGDKLNEVIHPDRIVYQVCAEAMRWYKDKTRSRHLDATIDKFERDALIAKDRHPLPPLPLRQSKVTMISRTLRIRD